MSIPVIERSDLLIEEIVEEEEDLSKKAHIVNPDMNLELWNQWGLSDPGGVEGIQMLVDMARKAGFEIVALCQYRWVPTQIVTNHDVCGACMAIAQDLISQG